MAWDLGPVLTVANFNAGQGGEWMTWITTQLGHGRPLFLVLYIALIVFFAFFYTAVVFNPSDTARSRFCFTARMSASTSSPRSRVTGSSMRVIFALKNGAVWMK